MERIPMTSKLLKPRLRKQKPTSLLWQRRSFWMLMLLHLPIVIQNLGAIQAKEHVTEEKPNLEAMFEMMKILTILFTKDIENTRENERYKNSYKDL